MSKAFTSEESTPEIVVPPRPPLPAGVPNYVTPCGLASLRAERQKLEAARAALDTGPDEGRAASYAAWATRMLELEARLSSAELIEPSPSTTGVVRFGSKVTVRDDAGRSKTFEIVGVDEADPALGKIAFLSPLAKAVLGAEVGDVVTFETPGRVQELEITASE